MFKIHRLNTLPTTGLIDGDVYYIPNEDNTNAMDVYVIDKNEVPNKISTTNGTEIVFKDSIGINDEIDNIYNEHTWVNVNEETSTNDFVHIWRGSISDYSALTEDEKSDDSTIFIIK